MARGLKVLFGHAPRRGRLVAWAALVAGVIVVHGCVTEGVARGMAAGVADAALPPRMEVAYVREMAISAPPPTAAPAAPPAPVAAMPTPRPKPKPKPKPKPPRAASAPEPKASDPVEALDAASAPASAASAPTADQTVAAAGSAVAAPAAPASVASGAAAAFQWPVSTKVSYLLTGRYRGPVSGTAEVEWVRVGAHYQVHVDFLIGAGLAPIITQHSTSDGDITALGLAPRRYDQDITVFGSARPRQTVLFDAGYVVLANGDVRTVSPGMQDTASQFVQLTYLFSTRPELLRVGGSVDIPLALPKKVDVWTYDVVAQETLDAPFGPLQAIHLKPRNARQPGQIGVEMWFAPQLQYFPARLRFEQDDGNYVDLMISKPPQMAR
jgi:hypothetical protein